VHETCPDHKKCIKNVCPSVDSGCCRSIQLQEREKKMKYLFLTYLDEKAWAALGESEQQRIMAESMPHVKQLLASGKFLGGAPLHPTSTATTVSVRNGEPLVTDGPFAETREQLGGYTLIDAEDLDEAIRIAACFLGTSSPSKIEIRPVVELDGLPTH
jgi:hypothetical protein